jgi:hypothetical protein
MSILNESLDYLDMEDQVDDLITVDEYASKMGRDEDIVTLAFSVNSKLAATDLVTWLERGYDFVLDASVSDGELEPGKWLVFVEMDRRMKVPNRIITLLSDLETLTGLKLKDWTVEIDGDEYDADEEIIRQKMILNPNEYEEKRQVSEVEINEMRTLAGLETELRYDPKDDYIRSLQAMAGL